MSLSATQRTVRASRIGASEVGAMFGLDPFCTRFELWHRKAGTLPEEDLSDNNVVFWGQTLEPAIAQGVAERQGWKVRKVHRDSPHPEIDCLGAHLDYEIVGHENGAGVLEIKTEDAWAFRRRDSGSPPLRYQLQLQTQLDCTGRKWGAIATLVGGNDLHVHEFLRHDGAIGRVREEAAAFWRSIAAGEEPRPDWHADAETISRLYGLTRADSVLDLTDNERFAELCRLYDAYGATERGAKADRKAIKAELLTLVGDAALVRGRGCKVTSWQVGESEFTTKRRAYRDMRVTVLDHEEESL